MPIVYDLGNAANWQLIWDANLDAPTPPNSRLNSFFPIPDFESPIQVSSEIVAVYCTSESDPGTWRRGGFIKQKIRTGIIGGGQNDAYLSIKPLYLRQINTITFPKVSSSYSLEFSVPFWLRQYSLSLYEYTGLIEDTINNDLDLLGNLIVDCCADLKQAINQQQSPQEIQEILNKLTEIQNKLNDCLNLPPGDSSSQQSQDFAVSQFTGLL